MRFAVGIWLACTGCSQIFGLDAPARLSDASIGEDVPLTGDDADLTDALADSATDSGLPVFRRRIDIEDAKVTGGPHADFPLLVSLTETWLRSRANGGDVASASGLDIYFTADGLTKLSHEVERYDPATGHLFVWVKVPSLAATTSIYLHYGDTSITTSQQNRAATWSSYAAVLHMSTPPMDVTANNASLSAMDLTFPSAQLHTGAGFNGTTSLLNLGSGTAIDNLFVGGGTVEAWIHPASFGENDFGRIFDKDTGNNGWQVYLDDVLRQDSLSVSHYSSGSDGVWGAPVGAITLNQWSFIAVSWNTDSAANDPVIYINGTPVTVTQVAANSGAFDSDATSDLVVGNNTDGSRTFAGTIDDVRLSAAMRTAGWIATQYQNQASPSTFSTVSAPL